MANANIKMEVAITITISFWDALRIRIAGLDPKQVLESLRYKVVDNSTQQEKT